MTETPTAEVTREDALAMIGKVWAGNAGDYLWRAFDAGDYRTARDLAAEKIAAQAEEEARRERVRRGEEAARPEDAAWWLRESVAADVVAQCSNPWHRSGSAYARQRCPECPPSSTAKHAAARLRELAGDDTSDGVTVDPADLRRIAAMLDPR
ncbi:hypothetical protein [Micromonospora sp. KC213]|uniref:hypothetical protein n=1 Tax=Micromonospora sp. KC213 TaxID=2530378 RepID=UPI0010539227|nr:hypothetical protein [Micromonospora sp. KC213]TDC33144.1 hypothetical protein E1166_25985 [Micromonospora sp. KC213]